LIRGGFRLSEKIMLKQEAGPYDDVVTFQRFGVLARTGARFRRGGSRLFATITMTYQTF
jgi:hypothetical protein